jgi:hypothetical protein
MFRSWFVEALSIASILALLLGTVLTQETVAADMMKGTHYTIEFDTRDRATAEQVGEVIDSSWNGVARAVGADVESSPVRVIVARSLDEFRELTGGQTERWILGVAVHPGSLIIVKPPRLVPNPLTNLEETVKHELTHVMLARVSNPENVPRWLNEGIAMRVSGEMRTKADWMIAGAIVRGALIPIDKLDERFPASHEGASLAYAESLSVVDYLADTCGQEGLQKLLRSLQHESFDNALATNLRLDIYTLSERWVRSVRISPYVITFVASFIAFWIMTALVIIGFVRKRRLGLRKKREWELEETLREDL